METKCTHCGRSVSVGNFQKRLEQPMYCRDRLCQNARRAAWKRSRRHQTSRLSSKLPPQ